MIELQIEPVSVCLGAVLVGLPLVAWIQLNLRNLRLANKELHQDLQASRTKLDEQIQFTERLRAQSADQLAAQRAEQVQREDDRQTQHRAQLEAAATEYQLQVSALHAEHTRRFDDLLVQHRQQLEEVESQHQQHLVGLKLEHAKALDEVRKEITIESFPYESAEGDDGWFIDDRSAEVGYQYQMFIRGVPCFEPHRVVLHRVNKKEVNAQKLADLNQKVLDFLEGVAGKHPAIQVSKKSLGR